MIKLADDARKTLLTWATEEARRRGDRRPGTDHLLLALLHDPDSGPARALGVDLESARAASDALERGARETRSAQEQETPDARETASAREQEPQGAREMRRTRTRRIETQHFLLALLTRERPDPAAELLAALRVDPKEVRARLTGPSR